jgi:hypothetical protein
MSEAISDDEIIAATRLWVERAVIGLNLCPFAQNAHANKQVRYVVSLADTAEDLLGDLMRELEVLAEAPSAKIETTLLIHPYALADFLDYNDFLGVADDALEDMELDGILQVASLHPHYQFADTEPDDIENYTNRSPYPTLHLLREASVVRAMESYPEADKIFDRNIETLRRLGHEGWKALGVAAAQVGKK